MNRRERRQRAYIQSELLYLYDHLPPGTKVHLDWRFVHPTAVMRGNEGWRITIELPKAMEERLDANVLAAHAKQPFTVSKEWVRWPGGLSFGGGKTLREVFADARRLLPDLARFLPCLCCGEPPTSMRTTTGYLTAGAEDTA